MFGLYRKNQVDNVLSYLIKETGFHRLKLNFQYKEMILSFGIYNINELLISNYRLCIQGISCADVADICVKALHDSTARNKSFDVGNRLFALILLSSDKMLK